ncbi:hypothetical protein DSM104443_03354 [Usitatibacter rugosus]|uniref:Alpha/beta hydrolase n=1 Tax=Usitatibacter rugosus TaxID=2732067 RepID=A0A6M4GYE1_9PROT|nr:alpha/beta hydrolase [Usitatibacter rugosus]QJR12269.1 hypothetical protein DSM104443_03354 [Usitatibacter rugosus]
MTTATLDPARGRDALPFLDDAQPTRPLVIHTYRPASHGPDDPVVLVQHGINRNGDDYRDFWIDAAERHRLLIVAPTFPAEAFPGPESYNNGLVVGEGGAIRAREQWLYGIPVRVIGALRAAGVTRRPKVRLFGHSAGGQFVHRLMAVEPHDAFEAVAPANSGWYTLPTLDRPFPEGLGGLGLGSPDLARWFAYPMVILAGDRDVDVNDANLPRDPKALAQGPTRYARSGYFHDFAQREAARLGLEFRWKRVTVPGVAHDGAAMSRAAAAMWFE